MGLNRRRKRLRNLCPEEVRDSDDYKTLVECFDKSFTIEPPYVAIREPQIGELFVPLLNNVEHKIVKELDVRGLGLRGKFVFGVFFWKIFYEMLKLK